MMKKSWRYLKRLWTGLGLLDDTLNKVAFTLSHLRDTTEQELNPSLTTEGFKHLSPPRYDINVPSVEDVLKNATPPIRSNVRILPLSLEDNSTILGTMSILNDLSKTLNLPNGEEWGVCALWFYRRRIWCKLPPSSLRISSKLKSLWKEYKRDCSWDEGKWKDCRGKYGAKHYHNLAWNAILYTCHDEK